jgi:ribosome biogenesis GTPase / thiamine phosphate phosphatase
MSEQIVSARVIGAHGRHYDVELPNGVVRRCYPKGKRNEATVGDMVDITLDGENEGFLFAVHPRKNLLYRSDEWRTKQFAANVDRLFIVVAVEPTFSDDLLGRALTGAWAADVEPVIVLNKVDLGARVDQARTRLAPYLSLGVPIVELVATDTTVVFDRLMPFMNDKTSLLLGQSAMGKSTILNALVPNARALTQEHSIALGAGKHTTTTTRLYHLPNGAGDIIDSPGVQAFGLAHLSPEDIERGFPEFVEHKRLCRFYNCSHQHEPGCGVLSALDKGLIDTIRHQLYGRLLEEKASAKI